MDIHSVLNAFKNLLISTSHVQNGNSTQMINLLRLFQRQTNYHFFFSSTTISSEQIFPNFLLAELISKHLLEQQEKERMFAVSQNVESDDPADNLKTFLASESKKLSLPDINVILEIFTQRKVLLEAESTIAQNKLLYEFLQHLLKTTESMKRELNKKINLIKYDMKIVEDVLKNVQSSCPKLDDVEKQFDKSKDSSKNNSNSDQLNAIRDEMKQLITDIDLSLQENLEKDVVVEESGSGVDQQVSPQTNLSQSSTYRIRRQRMFQHFEDFTSCYFTNRAEDLHFQNAEAEEHMITDNNETATGHQENQHQEMTGSTSTISNSLDTFRDNLVKFSKYSQLRTLS